LTGFAAVSRSGSRNQPLGGSRTTRPRLVVMTRFPESGVVKTRLAPVLGEAGALELHRELARHCIRRMHAAALSGAVDVEVHVDGASSARTRRWLGRKIEVRAQSLGDLGDRLGHAALSAIADGAPAVVLVGSDAPDLGGSHVRAALEMLKTCDVVLGPATDGGYYLVGLNRAEAPRAISALFESPIPWGSSDVLTRTLDALRAGGLRVGRLEELSDVDRPADLAIWKRVVDAEKFMRTKPQVSVIIPTFNEESEIRESLLSARRANVAEIIVVDAGSTDRTVYIARECGVATVIDSPRGRGRQLNAGAAQASGDILLFLHADSRLPVDALTHIAAAMSSPGTVLGSFGFRAGDQHNRVDRFISTVGRARQRVFKLPYGDQAPFLRRQDFTDLGGFLDVPVMEDYEFAVRCKRYGRITRVNADCTTSARAWHTHGLIRVTLVNAAVIAGYRLGLSYDVLARLRSRILARSMLRA